MVMKTSPHPAHSFVVASIGAIFAILVSACTPSHDWREIHGADAPYSVLLPAKPTSKTREITLNGMAVTMTMTAVEVDHVTYAVGAATLVDAVTAKKVMLAMKAALVGHVAGAVSKEVVVDTPVDSQIDLEAAGSPNGEPRVVVARFVAHDTYAYQAIVTGPKKLISRDHIETFITSFKVK